MSDAHYVLEISPADGEVTSRTIHEGSIVIGRREGDIVIGDRGASGRHAELRLTGEAVEVSDLGSTNGIVWQNAIARDPFSVVEGEWFQIGRTKFTITSLHIPPPAAAPEPDLHEEDDDEEEATASIDVADLGMEATQPRTAEMDGIEWYYELNSEPQGPVKESDLRAMYAEGTLPPGNRLWNNSLSGWTPAREIFGPRNDPEAGHE
jgi:hypothetical protein